MIFIFPSQLIPEPVQRLSRLLGPQKSYVVGGAVRDSIQAALQSGSSVVTQATGSDWDLTTPLLPEEVLSRLRKARITAVLIGIEHGTVAAVIEGETYEITTFRYDLEYTDGRHPVVCFADSLEEDLKRRDFTVNAFALDIETGEVLDLFDGLTDLQNRLIRTVGLPEERFQEDHLRMLRAARFAAKLDGTIEPSTFQAMQKNAHQIIRISAERIREEIMKMLEYPRPSIGFDLMHRSGLLFYIVPELEMGFDCWQNRFHSDDVAWHTLHAVDALSPKYPLFRFSTLMHDLGKVPCKQFIPEKEDYVFYGHQYASRRMAKTIMKRLRFSTKEIDQVGAIVDNHMYNLKPDLSDSATRRFIRKLGKENVDGFLRMRMADRKGNRFNNEGYEEGIFHFVRTLRQIEKADDALKVTDLEIGGYDLINLGLRPGPVFKEILEQLLDEVLDDPSLNRREWLLARAQALTDEFKQTGTVVCTKRGDETEEEADPFNGAG